MILSNYDDGAPRPRFIHGSTDYVDWDLLKFSIPLRGYRANNGPSEAGEKEPSVEAWTAYRYQMLCMTDEAKKRKLEARKKRAVTRHARQQKLNHELKRVQRYLGLRQSKAGEMTDLSAMSDAAKVDEVGLGVKETSLEEAKSVPRMDLNEKVVFPMESNVIFISVDVELYEMNKQLTEIGFATLDTSDIAGVPPGENGSNWFKHIRARHFAIEERRHMQNKKFCDSNLFGFNFG